MKTYINREKLTADILHALATQHLSRSQLFPRLIIDHQISEVTIQAHINSLVDSGIVIRDGKTSKQHYRLGVPGFTRYIEIMSSVTPDSSIKIK